MSANPIPEKVRNFVFEHVDSIESLEILLFFYGDAAKSWTFVALAAQLRSNPNSAESRTQVWRELGIIQEKPGAPGEFYYAPENKCFDEIIAELSQQYRIQRHKLFELIFSPMKKARDFADAFKKPTEKKANDKGPQDG